jgi:ribosome-associated protein
MAEEHSLRINSRLSIPLEEIEISFTRSSGPGGQHVNKTSTQAELSFDLEHSPSIDEQDRAWLLTRLATRIDSSGKLHVNSQSYRSQLRNKEAALEKLASLIGNAMERPKTRKKTRPTKSAKETRLHSKKLAGEKKRMRSKNMED